MSPPSDSNGHSPARVPSRAGAPGFCLVAVPVPIPGPFTYRIPPALEQSVKPGVRVVVPFGRRSLTGIVVALADDGSAPGRVEFRQPAEAGKSETLPAVRDVAKVLDAEPVVSTEMLSLANWVAEYYLAPQGEVLRAMLPLDVEFETRRVVRLLAPGQTFLSPVTEALGKGPIPEAALKRRFGLDEAAVRKMEREGLVERVSETRERRERVEILFSLPDSAPPVGIAAAEPSGSHATAEGEEAVAAEPVLSRREQRAVQLLISMGRPVAQAELAAQARVPPALLRDMAARGLLLTIEREKEHAPVAVRPSRHILDPRQETVVAEIRAMLAKREFGVALLRGVTGSGKTEVYMEVIADVVRNGGKALMLVPEIALTPAAAEQFEARFGEAIAILHSAFPGRRRSREWRRVHNGEASVVIGTRSAVFAPLERPGIVIVDEEHDGSYKQEDTPRYNGRDVAIVRARLAGGVALLGSATPSLESRYNAASGKYRLLELAERVEGRSMASVRVVDMRQEYLERRKNAVFSRALAAAVRDRLDQKQQVILLLNRRGYSPVVTCRSCGLSVQCVNCSISLTLHRRENCLKCHYCDYAVPVPETCPQCNSEHIHFLGEGSEKIESLVAEQFAGSRVVRLDRDSARGKQQYEQILADFKAGKFDILVGTQMIAKGHDIHRVTLVGVVSADIALGLPDFRAAERTFQLLTQVAGRAGRGELPGEVIIQTYFPDHYAVVCAAAQDYPAFFEKELKFRRAMRYPPFGALANILIRSTKIEHTVKWSGALARRFAEGKWPGVRVLGPAAAPLSKLKQEFRYQFLIKSERRDTLHRLLRDCLAFAREQQLPPAAMVVDVDPYTLM